MRNIQSKMDNRRNLNVLYFFKVPFVHCKVYFLIKIIDIILYALLPTIQVVATADFVNTALSIFEGYTPIIRIFYSLTLLIFCVAVEYLNGFFMAFINKKVEFCLIREFRIMTMEKRSKLEYCHIENNDTWNLISRTCDNSEHKVINGLNNLANILTLAINIISLLFVVSKEVWWVGIVIFVISFPLLFLSIRAGQKTYEANKEAEKYKRHTRYLQNILRWRDYIEERNVFGYTDYINERWYEDYEKARKISFKTDFIYFIQTKSAGLVTVIISLLIIAVLLIPLHSQKLTIGMFIALVIAFLDIINAISWVLVGYMKDMANSREFIKDLNELNALSEVEGAADIPQKMGNFKLENIDFVNVSFKYPDTERYILKNMNLHLDKNKHYAIVGVNGAGKTTLTKLLVRMYDNYEGSILINGKELRKYHLAEIKGMFSVVYQDFAKYYLQLKDSIGLGNVLEHNLDSICQTICDMELDYMMDKLPDGLNSWVGKVKEEGIDLSGGEWQRIAIARAIYNPAQIRILDEPTAALDPIAESNLYETFSNISKGITTILITHRLGAAKIADEIIVIADGQVSEKGSHSELIKLGGIYADMFNSQKGWYE